MPELTRAVDVASLTPPPPATDAYRPSFRDRMRVRSFRTPLERVHAAIEPQGLRLLDLGGGTGATTVVFGRGAREVVVLEPNERKAARGRAAGVPVTFVSGFAESIPFESGRFDRVSSHMSLHHFSDREKACREVARVLTDSGRFVIFDMHRHSLMVRWLSLFAGRTHHLPERFPTASELERDLRAAGFRRIDREELRKGWLVVATR